MRASASVWRTLHPAGDDGARGLPPLVLALDLQERAAVALAQLAALEQLEHLVGQPEQADSRSTTVVRLRPTARRRPRRARDRTRPAGGRNRAPARSGRGPRARCSRRARARATCGRRPRARARGIVVRPAACAARQRRSPAISSQPSPTPRTRTGWTMPSRRTLSTSSAKRSSSMRARGWRGFGVICSIGISRSEPCVPSCGSPSRSARPWPSPRRGGALSTLDDLEGKPVVGVRAARVAGRTA